MSHDNDAYTHVWHVYAACTATMPVDDVLNTSMADARNIPVNQPGTWIPLSIMDLSQTYFLCPNAGLLIPMAYFHIIDLIITSVMNATNLLGNPVYHRYHAWIDR